MNKLVIGTRRSRLARIQTTMVHDALSAKFPDLEIEEVVIVTKGDKILDSPLSMIGDKGLFTREIEVALIEGGIDLAVHSYKDLPTELPAGLTVGAVTVREQPEDALVGVPGATLESLAPGSRIGSSSLRRVAQIRHARPDLEVLDIRGNVNTRIDRLDAGDYDALVLAAAGLKRMGLENRISSMLGPENWFHAVSQGALAIETREGDDRVAGFVSMLEDPRTRTATDAERAFLRALEGGCQVPVGVRSAVENGTVTLSGMVASPDGGLYFSGTEQGADATAVGVKLAESLIDRGADKVLKMIRCDSETDGGEK